MAIPIPIGWQHSFTPIEFTRWLSTGLLHKHNARRTRLPITLAILPGYLAPQYNRRCSQPQPPTHRESAAFERVSERIRLKQYRKLQRLFPALAWLERQQRLRCRRLSRSATLGSVPVEGCDEIKQLSGGSEGEIYLIKSKFGGKLFILKRVRSNFWNENCRANEARMLACHIKPSPRIINMIIDFPDPANGSLWLMYMEYCSGGSLFEQYGRWIQQRRQHMPEVFLLHCIVQIAEALAQLHFGLRYIDRGQYTQDAEHMAIIHGDIKDENILLRWPEFPIGGMPDLVLSDFGTAKLADDREARVNPGTPCFNAPEDVAIHGNVMPCPETRDLFFQVTNNRTVAADLYSFGLVAYMIAEKANKPMFIGTDPATLEISREYKTPGLVELIRKMLIVDPTQRAEASFHLEKGILPEIHALRKERDELIAKNGPMDSTEWLPICQEEVRVDSKAR